MMSPNSIRAKPVFILENSLFHKLPCCLIVVSMSSDHMDLLLDRTMKYPARQTMARGIVNSEGLVKDPCKPRLLHPVSLDFQDRTGPHCSEYAGRLHPSTLVVFLARPEAC